MACVKNVLAETKPDIALFTETHLTEDKGASVDGYTFFAKSRNTGKGGGVGVFVKNELKVDVAPHYSSHGLEILWVSVNRKLESPLFIGVYYGKQETTCNIATIQEEMDNLSAEILELEKEGEVLICMDANAKIGLMNEEMTRNGKLITKVFQECELEVINGSEKCEGTITRQNRKKISEKSAIDLVVASYQASQWIKRMTIDEAGEYRMRGKNESDHNTILIEVEITKTPKHRPTKSTSWNLKAPPEKFSLFRRKLESATEQAQKTMGDKVIPITDRYASWEKLLYKAAISSIGKTTNKPGRKLRTSMAMKSMREERKHLKEAFEKEHCPILKGNKLDEYVKKQHQIKEQAIIEESEEVHDRFQKMTNNTNNGFWKERKMMKKDQGSTWLITKDSDGRRIFDPDLNKENVASYYEDLYSKKTRKDHPYHLEVRKNVERLVTEDREASGEDDRIPTEKEIQEAINKKKNKKATTDWKNEVIKRGGIEMVRFVYPVVKAFWTEETTPKQWNMGVITNVWKGKGDREIMTNQRGITVSSSISTIAEEILTNRISKKTQFTQAQAGGRKDGSTTDHVFTLRNIITIAKKERRNIIVTFYDVVKAYDQADMDDMCYSMYKSGIKGKLWRLMKAINEDLKAKIKTKAGLTREISRVMGGKQGGKLMVTMFAKTMDNMAEDMMTDDQLGIQIGEGSIAAQLYMDDATTFAEGYKQQERTLAAAADFAVKHRMDWGPAKCKTMEIGSQKEKRATWDLGGKRIEKCDSYKYLGERIHRNGKNNENLKERCDKVKYTARAIVTCCKTEIMRRVGTRVIMTLHEVETISAFLYNAETWTLNLSEKKLIDQTEIYAWKKMLGLPQTTPTAGIMFTMGSMFATILISIKQLTYLQKVLNKDEEHWTKRTLYIMKEYDIGWAKQIREVLVKWDLSQDWEEIRQKTPAQWKMEVRNAAERINIARLKEECETKSRGETKQKSKVNYVTGKLVDPDYRRKPDGFISQSLSVLHTRALIMGRYGMLKCANNFSHGHGTKVCDVCKVKDDEGHRINICSKWAQINLVNDSEKVTFDDIYHDDYNRCHKVVRTVLQMWDLENGKNEMRKSL